MAYRAVDMGRKRKGTGRIGGQCNDSMTRGAATSRAACLVQRRSSGFRSSPSRGRQQKTARSILLRARGRRSGADSPTSLVRQRIRTELEVRGQRLGALAAFDQPGRSVAIGGPQATAFPAGVRIVDAAVEPLGIEAERIGDADRHHLAVLV